MRRLEDSPAARRSSTHSWIAALAVALLATLVDVDPTRAQERIESDARGLEQRLRAPCCRGQMLDAHESEVTHSLRKEIRARLRGGESTGTIETDLVRRYGDSIVAVPLGRDPRSGLSLALGLAMMLAAAAIVLFGVRWVRRTRAADVLGQAADVDPIRDDELDARLEKELRALDR